MAQRLADGLAVYKCRNRLRNRDIGRALGIRDETVSRLLGGDRTVRLNMETLFKLEDMAKEVSYHEQDPKCAAPGPPGGCARCGGHHLLSSGPAR